MNEARGRVLSCLKYVSKKDGNPGIRLDYFFETEEAYKNTDNFVGFEPHDYFSDDVTLFDKAKDLIMKPVIIRFAQEPMKSNPMKLRAVIKDIVPIGK